MRSSLIEPQATPNAPAYGMRPSPGSQRTPVTPPPTAKQQRQSLTPVEGWLPLVLLAIAVYSVVYSVTAAISINHTTVLWITTAIGLLVGLGVSKSHFSSQAALHIAACLTGCLLSFFLTSVLAYHVSVSYLFTALHMVVGNGFVLTGTQNSDMVFLFYLSFLCFFLGYFGAWLVYRAHLPWLVSLVYVSIMLVNLNYISKRDLSFLIIILTGSLILLIVRIQLASQITQWKIDGLYTDGTWMRGMTTRFLQIASIFILLILPFSWLMPVLSQPNSGVTFWNNLNNAWSNVSHGNLSALTDPNKLFSPYTPPSNFFSNQLNITGSVNLPNGPVLTYTSSSPTQGQYLEGFIYDTFDGHTGWTTQAASDSQALGANSQLPIDQPGNKMGTVTTSITLLQPPQGDKNYIFGPAQPSSFSVPVTIYDDNNHNFVSIWTQTPPLTQNEHYQVTSLIPQTGTGDLSAIPLPSDSGSDFWTQDPNVESIEQYYLQVPKTISELVNSTAHNWTAGAPNTFAAVEDLQSHLSNSSVFTYSTNNDPIPSNTDIVSWLLKTHQGYCTYYASAMIVMARMLGIPARMANGFSQGHYDSQHKDWIVDGSDAHSWVQVYFPGYGWINFDPTPGYAGHNLNTPSPTVTPGTTHTPIATKPTPTVNAQKPGTQVTPPNIQKTTILPSPDGKSSNNNLLMLLSLAILLCSLVVLGFSVWRYRARSAGHSPVVSVYARLCHLATLVGSPPATSQTPYEYTYTLSQRFPQATPILRQIADLFVRQRWGAPQQAPAPDEERALERLWPRLRNTILRVLFLRQKN